MYRALSVICIDEKKEPVLDGDTSTANFVTSGALAW
jgi:hypothetical protein